MSDREVEYTPIDVARIVAITDRAMLLLIFSRGEPAELWVPKSVIEDAEEFERGDTDVVVCIAEWFVQKEGID